MVRRRWLASCAVLVGSVANADVAKRPVPPDAPDNALVAYAMEAQASADEFCDRNLAHARKQNPNTKNTCGAFAHKARVKLAGPWQDVRVVQLDEHATGIVTLEQYVELVARVDGNWYGFRLGHVPTTSDSKHGLEVTSISVRDVIRGGRPELVVETIETSRDSIGSSVESSLKKTSTLVCGFGKSGAPSCIRFVTAEDEASSVAKYRYQLTWSVDRKGQLVTKAKTPWPRGLDRRTYELKQPLYFL